MLHGLIPPLINFLILVAVLAYYLREPLKNYVSGRHTSLRDEVDRVRAELEKARTQFEEFSQKLSVVNSEIYEMKSQVKSEAEATKARVISEARRAAENIVTDARAAANGIYDDLKTQLRADLASHVVDRAEALLKSRLTTDDRARIRQEFSRQVGGAI